MALKSTYRRLLYVVIGVVAFLVLLPEFIRLGASYALKEFSAQVAEIEDVDLNLFTGRAGLTGVRIDYNDETTLSLGEMRVDLDMTALFGKQLLVETLMLSDVSVSAYENDGSWVAVLPIPEAEQTSDEPETKTDATGEPWKVGVNGLALSRIDIKVRFEGQQHHLQLDQVEAADLFMWEPDRAASLMLKGKLNDASLNFDSGLKPFAEPQAFSLDIALSGLNLDPLNQFLPETVEHLDATLNLDTQVSLQVDANGDLGIVQDGEISVSLDQLKAAGLDAAVDTVSWKGTVNVSLPKDREASVHASGEALVKALNAEYAELDATATLESLRWNGGVTVSLPKETQPSLSLEGSLNLKALDAAQGTLVMSQSLSSLKWQGDVNVELEAPDSTLKVAGDLKLGPWHVHDTKLGKELVVMESLGIAGLQVKGLNDVLLSSVTLTGVSALSKSETDAQNSAENQALASFSNLSVISIDLNNQNQLAIASITLSDLYGELTKTPQGNLAILDDWLADVQQRAEALQAKLEERQESNEPATHTEQAVSVSENAAELSRDNQEPASEFLFAVGEINLTGKNDFVFHDQSMEPAIVHPLSISALALGEIDSANASGMTPLNIEMSLYEHGLLKVTGSATPLQPLHLIQADLKADIKGIELPDLSPYIENTIGYHVNSGQLNVDSRAEITSGKLDSKTKVKILRVDMNPADQELIDKLGKKLSMPVETALSIITDSDNTLALTIPVKGDLTNPDIHLDRIIGGAVAQAVQNAAVTYFKYAVQPFGAIMMVSEKIGDMTLQAKFEPARFVPGTADLVSEQSGYLEKVAAMIKEKKDFSILVCVMVTDQDFKAREIPPVIPEGKSYEWDDTGKALAKSRLNLIKNSLINEHGLSPDRVQTCRPQLAKGEPRAIMGI